MFFCVTEKGINILQITSFTTKTYPKLNSYLPNMMIARSATISKTVSKRVSFKNDHPSLMKPRATDNFIFEKNDIIANFVHLKSEPVIERPRQIRFGRGRSLAEMVNDVPQKSDILAKATIEEGIYYSMCIELKNENTHRRNNLRITRSFR
jgi:hypothetical protein